MEAAPALQFNADLHEYRVENEVLPSVTQIVDAGGLYPFGRANEDPSFYMERGRLVHLACHYDDLGTLDEDEVDPMILPRLQAYRKLKKDLGLRILASEVPLWHPRMRFAGTIDKLIKWCGMDAVLELKCGVHVPAYGIQTAGYLMMAELPESMQALGLTVPLSLNRLRFGAYLGPDGKYKLVQHDDENDRAIFKHCLAIYHWKRRYMK